MSLGVGARLGHHTVTAMIGQDEIGEVWAATDTKLNRQLALKILPEAFAADPDRLARLQREAQVLATLNHPGIDAIYGIEEADTRAFVLELVEEPTLADRISSGPIPINEGLPTAKQIAETLEAAHEAGVIHRDLKPAKITVRDDPTTKMGVIMSTAYAAPEQAMGRAVDKRADVWAFGTVLFEILTGHRAFSDGDVAETLTDRGGRDAQ